MLVFEGTIKKAKESKWYEVSISTLGIFTQGSSYKNALKMAEDALETVIDLKGFKAETTAINDKRFFITANKPSALMSLRLKTLRIEQGLSIRELAKRLGQKSPEAWKRYERPDSTPTIDKLSDLLNAVDPDSAYSIKKSKVS